jgi:hypothetical protein
MFVLGSKLSSSKVVNNIEGYLNAFTFIFWFIAKFDKMCRVIIMRKEWEHTQSKHPPKVELRGAYFTNTLPWGTLPNVKSSEKLLLLLFFLVIPIG